MITKIPLLLVAAVILGYTSMASAANAVAAKHHPRHRVMLLEDSSAYGAPARVVGSHGGYSSDPKTRALELLSDEYPPGW